MTMRALTVLPGQPGSARLEQVPEPDLRDGSVLVGTLAVGVCGTDVEIVRGGYGWAPPGKDRLILGHESLGRVLDAPSGSGVEPGDLVVGIVRRPDPEPCPSCAVGEWDMCRNGRYTERGIKELDGYASEHFRIEPEYVVKVDPELERVGVLLEPTSIVAKAWELIDRIGTRPGWRPRRALITGAGPIGLLAALLAVQRDLDVHVFDIAKVGPKPDLVADLGATYHTGSLEEAMENDADVVVEATGVAQVVVDVIRHNAPSGIVCLTGVPSEGPTLEIYAANTATRFVLENRVVFGTVNANRRHYRAAAEALAQADRDWLERIITRRVPPEQWSDALERHPDDVKTLIDFSPSRAKSLRTVDGDARATSPADPA
jgi:glucose 1-dehydrogenase